MSMGANQQYTEYVSPLSLPNAKACVASMAAKTFGNYNEVWVHNVACRTISLALAGVQPDTHCPYVGPEGGMKCVVKRDN
ncbi:unnamed protein product [Diplocarpon coronariae]